MSQLHKHFTSEQVKKLFDRYLNNEVERSYIQEILRLKRRRFFALLKKYREDSQHFSIDYRRTTPTRKISPSIEQNIFKELTIEKAIIQNEEVPLKTYNYSYIKDRLKTKHRQKVSLG